MVLHQLSGFVNETLDIIETKKMLKQNHPRVGNISIQLSFIKYALSPMFFWLVQSENHRRIKEKTCLLPLKASFDRNLKWCIELHVMNAILSILAKPANKLPLKFWNFRRNMPLRDNTSMNIVVHCIIMKGTCRGISKHDN